MKSKPTHLHRRRLRLWLPLVTVFAAGIYLYLTRLPDYPAISQRWASSGVEYANTDSLAALRASNGRVLVAATSKWEKRVDLFDGSTGEFVRSIATPGFVRPNGIAVANLPLQERGGPNDESSVSDPASDASSGFETQSLQLLIVVDRDAPGVFLFDAESQQFIQRFGDDLKNPYGVATVIEDNTLVLLVTDVGRAADEVVTRYRLSAAADAQEKEVSLLEIHRLGTFGDADAGRIGKPESVVIDGTRIRILLCDEDRSARNVKVYDWDGAFTGTTFGDGIVRGDPEGIVVVRDREAGDFVLVTDQTRRLTAWHAFDADNYEHLASFTGDPRIANTDGICIFEDAFGGFAAGGLFAVNDDADVRAYELAEIRKLVREARLLNVK